MGDGGREEGMSMGKGLTSNGRVNRPPSADLAQGDWTGVKSFRRGS